MRIKFIKTVCTFFLLVISITAYADNSLAVDFVKSFYVALQKAEAETSLDRIPKLKEYFDPELYQLLLNDDANRATNKEHLCGFVAFDVFGNFREDGTGDVKTELVASKSGPVQVAVTLPGTQSPELTMLLKNENGKWKIINIIYPTDTMGTDGLVGKFKEVQKVVCPKEVETKEVETE